MLDKTDSSIIHIDFESIFGKAKNLPVPERVNFRLTKNLETALGAFKAYGLFRFYMVEMAHFFYKKIDDNMGTLDSFVHDLLVEIR